MGRQRISCIGLIHFLLWAFISPSFAQENNWRVERLSGEAWLTRGAAPAVALVLDATLNDGDKIQTSRNGRVQLARGAEKVIVAPNTILEVSSTAAGARTIIRQQSGSLTMKAEKKNIEHFEVRTPILAALVKGTEFTVTLKDGKATVGVTQGQVDVTSFKSGQSVLVLPGQRASAGATGRALLSVTGAGEHQKVRSGAPVQSDVKPVSVPRDGFTRPSSGGTTSGSMGVAPTSAPLRITASIGPRIDIHKVTKGLASEPMRPVRSANGAEEPNSPSIWKQQATALANGTNMSASSQGAIRGNSGGGGGGSAGAGGGATAAGGAALAGGAAGAIGGGAGIGNAAAAMAGGNGAGGGASGAGNAVSAAAHAAQGGGGAAVSAAVRAVNGRKRGR